MIITRPGLGWPVEKWRYLRDDFSVTVVEHHSFSAKYKQDAALGGGRLGQRGERRRRILLIYF